jgi:uncharacterized protein YjbI with pentapeptide repeats
MNPLKKPLLFLIPLLCLSFEYKVHSKERIDLNKLAQAEIAHTKFADKELFFTGPVLIHPDIFANKSLNSAILNMDLTSSGIEKAVDLIGVDFTGSTHPPAGFVIGKSLWRARLSGLDLTHIGIEGAVALGDVDFAGSTNPPAGFAKGKGLWSARLSGLDLTHIGIEGADGLRYVDFTGSTHPPEGFAKGKDLHGAKLSGLDLTHIGIEGADGLRYVDFTGSTNPPAGFAEGKDLRGAKLSGLDLSHIGIEGAEDLSDVDFTGSTNPPAGFAKGKKFRGAKLSGLDLTHIGIEGAGDLNRIDFTGSTNPPAGFAKGKSFWKARLSGLDLTYIGIEGAVDLRFVDFTGAFNPPGGLTLEQFEKIADDSRKLKALREKIELKKVYGPLKKAEIDGDFSRLNQDLNCYQALRKKTLQVMQAVWPSISEAKKSTILKNKACHQFLRNESIEYPGFKILSRVAVSHFEEFSKNLPRHFLVLCSTEMTPDNYYDQFKKSLSDPVYGTLFASLLDKEHLQANECKDIKINITTEQDYKTLDLIPKWDDLPKSFDQQSSIIQPNHPAIETYTGRTYAEINKRYRKSTVTGQEHKAITSELSTLPPLSQTHRAAVWREANSSFGDVPFKDLKEGKVYCERAPTSTSKKFGTFEKKKGTMRVRLLNEFQVARVIGHISKFSKEKEVLLPPNSCFRFEGKRKENISGTDIDVYDYLLVPWSEDPDYGSYSRELAIQESNKYYGRDYSQENDRKQIGEEEVARPNHGLTHGARQAYLALDLLQHFAEKADHYGEIGNWARDLRLDERKNEILFLMALHFRAARLREEGNYFPEYVEHIKKVLRKSQLLTDPHEIDRYADLFSEKPELADNEKRFMMTVLDTAHRADHLRMKFWDVNQSENEQKYAMGENAFQNVESQKDIIQFMQGRAKVYLKATGAFNVNEDSPQTSTQVGVYYFTDPELFGRLENNPKELYQVMENASKK